MIKEGDGHGGEGFHFEPSEYNSVLIWLHGKGDNAESYKSFIYFAKRFNELNKTKIILPTSEKIFLKKFGIFENAWFDMENFSIGSMEDIDGINKSVSRLTNIISSEIEKGVDSTKISLGGFSQGSAIAFLISLASSKFTLGSCVVVGGWLPLVEKGFMAGKDSEISSENLSFEIRDQVRENVDFLVLHGEADPVVLYQWSIMCRDYIQANFNLKNFSYKSYPGVDHTINYIMLLDIFNFISKKMS
ncbi:hypothetical protein FG386_003393 [Cryptosporidium ryanae]|uniref:uncharacterized protein n=1 Tax=Cryptosporidium ryanae TaxID=515981 RepID=UPI00351A4010|nr:hypothetical protein FG386_003393 [Cryptosporidium ryanae]